ADPSPERQTPDARGRNDSARRGKSESMGRVVDVPPGRPTRDTHLTGSGIDAYAPHRGEVDHECVVGDAQAARVVASTPDGQEQPILAGEVDSRHHVRD